MKLTNYFFYFHNVCNLYCREDGYIKTRKTTKKNQNELLEFIAMKVEPKVSDFIGVRISCTAVYCL